MKKGRGPKILIVLSIHQTASSYIHWSIYSPLQHPSPCSRSCIVWVHGWQINSFGVELFLDKVKLFIEQLVHLYCFLVNCSSDGLQKRHKRCHFVLNSFIPL